MTHVRHQVGDIITSSSLLTINGFGILDTDMIVTERNVFKEPHGLFVFTGYVCEPIKNPESKHMVLVRESGSLTDMRIYRLDQTQPVSVLAEHILVQDGSDFRNSITTCIEDTEGNMHPVPWTKSGSGTMFGVEADTTSAGKGLSTLCGFESDPPQTGFDCSQCFISVFGPLSDPSSVIEIWFGIDATDSEIKFSKATKPLI